MGKIVRVRAILACSAEVVVRTIIALPPDSFDGVGASVANDIVVHHLGLVMRRSVLGRNVLRRALSDSVGSRCGVGVGGWGRRCMFDGCRWRRRFDSFQHQADSNLPSFDRTIMVVDGLLDVTVIGDGDFILITVEIVELERIIDFKEASKLGVEVVETDVRRFRIFDAPQLLPVRGLDNDQDVHCCLPTFLVVPNFFA